MTNSQRLQVRLSEIRSRLNEIAGLADDQLTDEVRAETDRLSTEYRNKETQFRAATIAEGEAEQRARQDAPPDAEQRQRVELRSKASLTAFLQSAIAGRRVAGAELELLQAAGVGDGQIPLELWDVPRSEVRSEQRADAPTAAPGTVGVNLDPIRPAVFANSIAARLGIDMPNVGSGTYATATINTSLTAGAKAKGAAADSTAAAFALSTATPKRISARMSVRIEDVAAIGVENFEAALRQNLSLVLSDELDKQAINGDGQNDNLTGILHRLTDPTAPTAVADFNAFAGQHADGVDGLWSATIKEVAIVVGPATYRLAAKTFQTTTGSAGELSAAAYAQRESGGFWTNKRMPDAASTIQAGILYRMGRSMMGGSGAMRTAVLPHWNMISIDDIYSGSAQGERYLTMHVLLGDVIIVQPAAYAQVAYKVA